MDRTELPSPNESANTDVLPEPDGRGIQRLPAFT
jgi:hypothetical protein